MSTMSPAANPDSDVTDSTVSPMTPFAVSVVVVLVDPIRSMMCVLAAPPIFLNVAPLEYTETPEGTSMGVPDVDLLQAEVDAYAEVGLFGGEAPDVVPFVDATPIASVYDDTGAVIWPG